MEWQTLRRIHFRRDVEFRHNSSCRIHGITQGSFHFLRNDVFTEGTSEVLDSAGHDNSIRVFRDEFDGVANVITPQAGIACDDQGVLHPQFNFMQCQSAPVLVKVFPCGYEFVKNSIIDIQPQSRIIQLVLVGEKSFGRRKQLNRIHVATNQCAKALAVRFKCHPSEYK